ncbi:16S rRNA (cytidine(1402)-2'-O)-methyltransferase [soil metagenome]
MNDVAPDGDLDDLGAVDTSVGLRGQLVLVATPIGNLADLTPRAVEALAAADLVCCEDTRRTGRLLQHAGVVARRLAVCNEHTERSRVDDVLGVLGGGGIVALVSDAGTPGISDPGERLVRAVLDAGYEVTTCPGPTALMAALVSSGLPTGRFVFEGFLPRRGAERRQRLAEIARELRTVVLYEAPHRVAATLADLAAVCGGDRPVTVARELTKRFETILRTTLGQVDVGSPRGEYVVVIGGASTEQADAAVGDDAVRAELAAERGQGLSTRDAVAAIAARTGRSRREVYALAVARSEPDTGTDVRR